MTFLKKRKRFWVLMLTLFLLIISFEVFTANISETCDKENVSLEDEKKEAKEKEKSDETKIDKEHEKQVEKAEDKKDKKDNEDLKTITISMAGDTTLGEDERRTTEDQYSFNYVFEREGRDYGFFFRNIKEVFEESDVSLVNFEGTLTEYDEPEDKQFVFKGPPEYAKILTKGYIDAVSLANNHSFDYGEEGFRDTINSLKRENIGYFIDDITYSKEIDGIKFKFLGFTGWNAEEYTKNHVGNIIERADEDADVVVVSFHWGDEYVYYPNEAQKTLGRFAVDKGADLVWGHHPHVLQGIENYQGVNIAYSLGNFSFGGNTGPKDMDTIIYKQHFHFKDDELIDTEYEIIPCRISSVEQKNNFQPTPLEGEEAKEVLKKFDELSRELEKGINISF